MSETETRSVDPAPPSKGLLGVLTALALVATGWAFFLWWQLLRARSGLEPVCIGSAECAALWDAAFASGIHRFTGLPVAAWGAVWGAVATFASLRALGQVSAADEGEADGPWLAATRWIGFLGLAGVVVLLGASAAAGMFCGSCAVTYGVTILFGLLALWGLGSASWTKNGLVTATICVLVAWGILLYPGIRTPKNVFKAGQEAFEKATGQDEAPARVEEPVHTDKSVVPEDNPMRVASWPLAADEQTRRLKEQLVKAPPQWQEALSAILERYRTSEPASDVPPPRHLKGQADADLQITIFTDSQCGHCAQLHATLAVLSDLFPPAVFNVDSRHFPLDGRCNAYLGPNPDRASCVAAKARICVEDQPDVWDLETEIYRLGQEMDEDKILKILSGAKSEAELKACIASAETADKLRQDVELAMHFNPTGTPVVLLNGKLFTHDPMMIYLLLLAGGDADHAGFAELPPPPEGGVDPHAGHNH